MKSPAPIYVYLREGRHATQPWTFTIDRPGAPSKETKSERYARLFTAKRGALRMLGAEKFDSETGYIVGVLDAKRNSVTPVKFYTIRRTKKKA